MKKKFVVGLAMGLFLVGIAGMANATTIDLYSNFPDTQGDNGFYAYGYSASSNKYWLLSDAGSYAFDRPGVMWGNPTVSKGSLSVPTGGSWVSLDPSGTYSNSGSPEDAVLAYLVPETEYYQLSGTFWQPAGSTNGIDVYIKKGDAILWSSHLNSGESNNYDIAKTLFNAGDTIYFGVDAHNYGGFSECNDWGKLQGKMFREPAPAPVPEPATMLLFGTGLAGLVGTKIRKKEDFLGSHLKN